MSDLRIDAFDTVVAQMRARLMTDRDLSVGIAGGTRILAPRLGDEWVRREWDGSTTLRIFPVRDGV